MTQNKINRHDLLLTTAVAVMTSYWLVDLLFISFLPTNHSFRIIFNFFFFVAQLALISFIWNGLKKRRQLQGALESERQSAEEEKNRTQSILSAIGEGISIQDRSFHIIYQNDVHKKLVGKDCLGELCFAAYSGRADVCPGCPVVESFSDGQTHLQEKRLVRSEAERYIEIFSSPMFDREGQIIAGIEMVRDVTHRVQAEREILKLNKELQQRSDELSAANHDLESFNYSLSHDLRSPLAQIETAIDLLAKDIEEHDLMTENNVFFIKTIRDGSGRIDQMIQGMLDLARFGQGEISRGRIDFSAMAGRIMMELQRRNPERIVKVMIAPDMTVHADPRLTQIVLLNLLENAWKYTRHVAVPFIEVGCKAQNGQIYYFVRDNGAGFNPDYSDRIFKPFQRLHDAQDFPGDGIGLSTVYRIIKKHGGEIQAQGEVEKGATFTFTFESTNS